MWYYTVTLIERSIMAMCSKRIAITLSDTKAKELEELAKAKGVTKSVLVTLAIEEFMKKGESNESK